MPDRSYQSHAATGQVSTFQVLPPWIPVFPPQHFGQTHLTFRIEIPGAPEELTELVADQRTLTFGEGYFYRRGELFFSPKSFSNNQIAGSLRFEGGVAPRSYRFKIIRVFDAQVALTSLENQVENFERMSDALIEHLREKGRSRQTLVLVRNALDDNLWSRRIEALDYIEETMSYPHTITSYVDAVDRIGSPVLV